MEKGLAESLRHMQSHSTTGTPHNQQVISTQVETVFMLDRLKTELIKLRETIEKSEKQNQRLELSNYKLQRAMLILTAIGTVVVVYPGIKSFVTSQIVPLLIKVNFSTLLVNFVSFLAPIVISFGIITLLYWLEKKYSYKIVLKEKIGIHDNVSVVLKDKFGRIKEIR